MEVRNLNVTVTVIILFVLSGCGEDVQSTNFFVFKDVCRFQTRPTTRSLVVAASDYRVGKLAMVPLHSLTDGPVVATDVPIHHDAIARAPLNDGCVYVVNRYGQDNIQIVERTKNPRIGQFSAGRDLNIQDIAVVGEKAYISNYNTRELLVADLNTGKIVKHIDIGAKSDKDNKPEMHRMLLVGSRLLVQLQNLDRDHGFAPTEKSYLAVIDTDRDALDGERPFVELKVTNPVSDIKRGPDANVYVAGAGFVWRSSKLDGGIVSLNSRTLGPQELIIDEKTLKGDIVDFEILRSDLAVAIVSRPFFAMDSRLVRFNPADARQTEVVLMGKGDSIHGLVLDREKNQLFVLDRSPSKPGIQVLDAQTLRVKENLRLDVGLPPFHAVLSH